MTKLMSAAFSVCLTVDNLCETELNNLLRDLRAHIGSTYWHDPVKGNVEILNYQTSLEVSTKETT